MLECVSSLVFPRMEILTRAWIIALRWPISLVSKLGARGRGYRCLVILVSMTLVITIWAHVLIDDNAARPVSTVNLGFVATI